MSQHRTWDENRSPQWKYLFQKEASSRRKSRRELDKEIRDNIKEQEEEYSKTIKFGEKGTHGPKRIKAGKRNVRKVTKEELQNKLQKAMEVNKKTIL